MCKYCFLLNFISGMLFLSGCTLSAQGKYCTDLSFIFFVSYCLCVHEIGHAVSLIIEFFTVLFDFPVDCRILFVSIHLLT